MEDLGVRLECLPDWFMTCVHQAIIVATNIN